MAAISSDVDDAVVVIQQASRSIEDAVQKMGSYEGKQQELLTAIKAIGERVADIEKSLASTNASKAKEKCSPSPYERNLVRSVYQDMLHGGETFKLDEKFEDTENQLLVSNIVTECKTRCSSVEEDHIRCACHRYFTSLYEDHQRALKGSKDKHRLLQRRLRRKKQKLANRIKVLEKSPPANWSTSRKSRMAQLLSKGTQYISSEESSEEDSSKLYVRPLSWMKRKYTRSMKELDNIHAASLSKKSKGMLKTRELGEPSSRPEPEKPLPFAVLTASEAGDQVDLDDSTLSQN